MSNYIERYWRDATPQDAIKEPPMVARFRDEHYSSWVIGKLIYWDRSVTPWNHEGDYCYERCQVYDAPDFGEGYRLIDHTEKPMPGDEHFVNNWGWCWCGEHISGIPYTDDLLLRRPIRKPKPVPDPGEGWRLIDVEKEQPQVGDEIYERARDRWLVRSHAKPYDKELTYRRRIEQPKPAPKYVPFTWDDREQLRGRWIVDRTGEQEYTIDDFLNDNGILYICGHPAEYFLNWQFLDSREPVGRRVE